LARRRDAAARADRRGPAHRYGGAAIGRRRADAVDGDYAAISGLARERIAAAADARAGILAVGGGANVDYRLVRRLRGGDRGPVVRDRDAAAGLQHAAARRERLELRAVARVDRAAADRDVVRERDIAARAGRELCRRRGARGRDAHRRAHADAAIGRDAYGQRAGTAGGKAGNSAGGSNRHAIRVGVGQRAEVRERAGKRRDVVARRGERERAAAGE